MVYYRGKFGQHYFFLNCVFIFSEQVKDRIGAILNPMKMGVNIKDLTSYPVNGFPTGVMHTAPNVSIPGDPNSYDPKFPHDFPQDFDPSVSKPHEVLEMVLSDCKAFPDQKGIRPIYINIC